MKIDLVNYEIIEKASLEIEGITLLLGPSNQGKSAVVRAIRSVLYGRMGEDYIRFGTPSSTVSLTFGEHFIVRSKTKTSLVYYIDGARYDKVGRTCPVEIENLFRFKGLPYGDDVFLPNFYNPDESLFLVKYSPSERFALLSLVIEESKFGEIVRAIADSNKQAGRTIESLETQIKLLDDEVRERVEECEKYKEIVPFFEQIGNLELAFEHFEELQDVNSKLVEFTHQYKVLDKQILDITQKLGSFVDLSDKFALVSRLKEMADELAQTSYLPRVEEKCSLLANCVEAYRYQQLFMNKSLADLKILSVKNFDLASLRESYISLDKACEFLRSEVQGLDKQITTLRDSLTECPTCGSTLDEAKKNRILSGRL